MSDDPKQGVVDRNCKVHDVDNLYLGGCSTFATGGHANPTYTITQWRCGWPTIWAARCGSRHDRPGYPRSPFETLADAHRQDAR